MRKCFSWTVGPRGGLMARPGRPARAQIEPPPELAGSGHVFDRIQRLAMALFPGCEAQVTLVGEGGRVWRSHDPEGRLPKDAPGVRATVAAGALQWVPDAREDSRLSNGPGVKQHGFRF